jgi:hypothetical protein
MFHQLYSAGSLLTILSERDSLANTFTCDGLMALSRCNKKRKLTKTNQRRMQLQRIQTHVVGYCPLQPLFQWQPAPPVLRPDA